MYSAKKKIVLVIGGSGFLGSHVVDELVLKNYRVISYDVNKPTWPNKKCNHILGNISKKKKTQILHKKCTYSL